MLNASTVNSVGLSYLQRESYNMSLVAFFYRLCSKYSIENLLLRCFNMKTAPMSCTLAFFVSLGIILVQSISSGEYFNLLTLDCDSINLMINI